MAIVRVFVVTVLMVVAFSGAALATNGMLIEGYGPVSHAMGGTSMAFDNGAAAMSNNPATLGLMDEGNRIDLAFGMLMPEVKFKMPHRTEKSDANIFTMPAMGYVGRSGDWGYGVGLYSQGGMGTDFDDPRMFSQVVVGKVLVPVSYNVTDKLTLGVTAEYIWAGMDMVFGPFDFKDGSDFTGSATSEALTGKLGFVYKLHDRVNVGGAYQFKGNLGDLTGKGARVQNFDMPAVASAGLAVNITDDLMVTADYSRIFWSETMKTITVSQNGMTMGIPQNWDDQNVFALGLAYKVSSALTLRAGASFANNPIQDHRVPVFPAIIENHYTAGFGYAFNEQHSVNASFAYAPKVEQKNDPNMFPGTSTSHSQTHVQFMYSYTF